MERNTPLDLFSILETIRIYGITKESIEDFIQRHWIDDQTTDTNREKSKIIEKIKFVGFSKDQQEKISDFKYWLLALPLHVLQRGHLKKITLLPPTWFKKGVTMQNIKTFPGGPITTNVDEAASVLSLPCGNSTFLQTEEKTEKGNPIYDVYQGEVQMFAFPWEEVERRYPKHRDQEMLHMSWLVYEMYVFFHEVSHTYIKAPYYAEYYAEHLLKNATIKDFGYQLTLPYKKDGIPVKKQLDKIQEVLKKYPGEFGQYSALYTEQDDAEACFQENSADASASRFIGFVMDEKKMTFPHELTTECIPQEVGVALFNFWYATASIVRKE